MIISLCGNNSDTKNIITTLQKEYQDKLLVINYFLLSFHERINNSSNQAKMTRKEFLKEIEQLVNKKITKIITTNKNKIIILISNNILEKEINQTPFFNISDLKILVTSDKYSDSLDPIFGHQILYKKEEFDYVISNDTQFDIRKLVKIK